MLHIDYRESELLKRLATLQVEAISHPMPVGDIWIGVSMGPLNNGVEETVKEAKEAKEAKEEKEKEEPLPLPIPCGGLVVERKSIQDMEASFLDGRYREQRGRILAFCQERNAQPLYLLEGAFSTLTGRIAKKALFKLLNRLTLKYQIPIVHTQNTQETAEWVQATVEQWREDPTALQRTQDVVKVSDGIHVQKKKNASDPHAFAIACLAQCPGVSVKIAESLVTTYGALPAIVALTQQELQEHKVGARRVGPALAKKVWGLLHV